MPLTIFFVVPIYVYMWMLDFFNKTKGKSLRSNNAELAKRSDELTIEMEEGVLS